MTKAMRAAVKTAEGDFKIVNVTKPVITQPNDVLIKVREAGICGSDLHSWKVPRPEAVGRITGHELAGDIVAVGDNVTNVKPGDRVGVDTIVSCGTCYWCQVGQYHICPDMFQIRSKTLAQAFSEYVVGPAKNCYPIPDTVGYGEAAIMDVYGTSVHAINRTGTRMGQTVVILGAGPIGLSLLDLVNLTGAKAFITDILDFPLEFAEKTVGAFKAINSLKIDPVAEVMKFTDNRGADVVFEGVGGNASPMLLQQAIAMVRRKGKIALIGAMKPGTSLSLDWQKLQWGEIDMVPVSGFYHWGNDTEFQIVTDLLTQGKLSAKDMITHTFPLEQINEAFETAANKKETKSIKVTIAV